MNISLTPTLEQLIQEKVMSGLYNSASEVIREALRLLVERDEIHKQRIDRLNREIDKGLQSIKEGKTTDGEMAMQDLLKRFE